MKKSLLTLAVAIGCAAATAQQYIIVNDDTPLLMADVEKITYEQDDRFEQSMLTDRIAADSRTQLFSQALQLTGLADTLKAYIDNHYAAPAEMKYYYKSYTWSEVAWYNEHRFKKFTVFAETDDVFATQGITTLDELKAYAREVYDEAFPEDAAVSDPTDRRNSLNRFMAYHILPFGSSYWYLTYYDGKMTDKFVDTKLTDMNVWYGTLMPQGSLKCSYPLMGNDSGIYLNHRGLNAGPDKYGKQVRGAKVVADDNANSDDTFTHQAFNGYYYHIDRILAYDCQTRDDVLGSELWRVDFKNLCPDIMNNADELRGNYLADDDPSHPDDSPTPKNGRNYIYKWNALENITGSRADSHPGLIARRAHANFWCWPGDEMNVLGDFGTIDIKLPPLPAGEWEVRLAHGVTPTRPNVRIRLNGEVAIDELKLSQYYMGADIPFSELANRDETLDYLSEHVFTVTQRADGSFLITDVKTGEQILSIVNYLSKDYWNSQYGRRRNFELYGVNPDTGEDVDWSERSRMAVEDCIVTLYHKMLLYPQELFHFNSAGGQYRYAGENGLEANERTVRYVLGRITSDGKSDNHLSIEYLGAVEGNDSELQLDFFEFVPKAVYDNAEIPEE